MKQFKRLGIALGAVGVSAALCIYLVELNSADSRPSAIKSVTPSQESRAEADIKTPAVQKAATIASVQRNVAAPTDTTALAADENINPDYPTIEYRLDEMRARRQGKTFDASDVKAAMQQPAAWQTDPSVADGLNLDNEERYDGREFIRFSGLKLESLVPGDEMEIPIAQLNNTYQMVVDGVRVHTDGNVSWYGHLKDFPSENQVAFTRNAEFTVGGITVQDKQYTLQAQGDTGWLAESFTLFKGHDEHLHPDVSDAPEHDHTSHQHTEHQHDNDT